MKNLSWLLFAALAACSGEKPATDTDTTGDTNPGDDDDDDTTIETGTSDTGTPPPPAYFEPGFVAFTFDGVIRSNGALEGYTIAGYGDVPPLMVLTYVDVDYFYATNSTDEDAHSCLAVAVFGQAGPTAPFSTFDGAPLIFAYDVALGMNQDAAYVPGVIDVDCAGKVDPATWGATAENLVDVFSGAHFGYGWGQLTSDMAGYLGTSTTTELGDSIMSGYVAINDQDGVFTGYDWNLSLFWQWDPTTREPLDDGSGYLVPETVVGVPPSQFPDAYVRDFPFWYNDFPYMDFSNLQDGAP